MLFQNTYRQVSCWTTKPAAFTKTMHTQNCKSSISEKVNMITFTVNVIIFEYNEYVLLPHVKIPVLTEERLNSPWQHVFLVL